MAYTIAFLKGEGDKLEQIRDALIERLEKDGRFRADFERGEVKLTRSDYRLAEAGIATYSGGYVPCLRVRRIRLTQKKPYCGNHPGPCLLDGKPKPNSTLLEWDDWVAFHRLINAVLNRFRARAHVWSLPYDVKGRMWIRQDRKARQRWNWHEEMWPGRSLPVRIWNQGTPDQFEVT